MRPVRVRRWPRACLAAALLALAVCAAHGVKAHAAHTATGAPATDTVECLLPAGGFLRPEAMETLATVLAWLTALEREAAAHSPTVARLAAHDMAQRRALMAAGLPPRVHTPPRPDTTDMVRVRVSFAPDATERAAGVRAALLCPERLRLARELLDRLIPLAGEAREAALASHRALKKGHIHEAQGHAARFAPLVPRIASLWRLQTLLPQCCTLWSAPEANAAHLREALGLDPENALAWCALGAVELQADAPRAALKSLDEALRLDPELATARATQGLSRLRLGQPALAENDLSAALRAEPDNPAWLRARGAVRMVLGKNAAMCDDFHHACRQGDCEGLAAARKRGLCLRPTPAGAHGNAHAPQ